MWHKFLESLHAVVILGCVAVLTTWSLCGYEAFVQLRHFGVVMSNVDSNLGVIRGGVLDVEDVVTQEKQSLTNQSDAITAGLEEFNALLSKLQDTAGALRTFIDHGSDTIITLNTAIGDQQLQLDAMEKQGTAALGALTDSLEQLQPILARLSDGSESLAQLLADPHLPEILARLDIAIDNADGTLANLDKMAASGDRSAEMLEAKLREALKPASLAKTLLERALGLAGPAAQVTAAVK